MDAINHFGTTTTNKNDILDPLSIIIKLFIYSYKPAGTKISIGNNRIYIQESTYIQGIIRKINGDTKNDITILTCPVLYACLNYLKNTETRSAYIPIFKIAMEGLVNMKQTYTGTPIIYNIEHIINIIQLFLDDTTSDTGGTDSVINQDTPLFKIKEHIYHLLNDSWTTDRKNILFGYIREITDIANTNINLKLLLIDGLSKFMDCMDTFVSNTLLHP
jgi:hypothetical protein